MHKNNKLKSQTLNINDIEEAFVALTDETMVNQHQINQ